MGGGFVFGKMQTRRLNRKKMSRGAYPFALPLYRIKAKRTGGAVQKFFLESVKKLLTTPRRRGIIKPEKQGGRPPKELKMIIDLILDRKDNEEAFGEDLYSSLDFYYEIRDYEEIFGLNGDISKAMDYGTENDVKKALCDYIDKNDYNPEIKNYINSKLWIEE